jgi:hypothetical protein
MPVLFDETFPHRYAAAEHDFDAAAFAEDRKLVKLGETSEGVLFFPPEIQQEIENVSHVAVRVNPDGGQEWVGVFACGFDSNKVASGLYAHPDPNRICVVAAGYGYIVIARDPRLYERVIAQPVVAVYPAREAGLLLFTDFTNISAYGPEGIVWRTDRLTWEGLRVTSVTATTVHGFGWDMPRDKEVEFTVDLKTGEHAGGAAPGK